MAKKKKRKKVTSIGRNPRNINVGSIIFLGIFIYLLVSVYSYMTQEKVRVYEVAEGSIVDDRSYTGLILRQESVKYTDAAGYVNYYVREGKKTAVGTCVYSIDETGEMKKFLDEYQSEGNSFSNENLEELKRQLSSFSLSYQDNQFDSVYDVKYNLEAAVLEYANLGAIANLSTLMQENGISFQQVYADQAGVVSYGIDSFEEKSPETVSQEDFNRNNYQRKVTKAGTQIAANTAVYKVVTSENWDLVFELTEEEQEEYGEESSLTISFPDYKMELSGSFEIFTGSDAARYGKVTFDRYMTEFLSERYVNFEIVSDHVTGLKIPISSVTTKEFYVVPVAYLTELGDSSNLGFLREIYTAEGSSAEFVPATIYDATEEVYYVDKEEFSAGDVLIKKDSDERYQVGPVATLQGVYNVNKGYTVFKQIEILTSNDSYYIIQKGTSYGLAVYDHIVLDASMVEEDVTIYQQS